MTRGAGTSGIDRRCFLKGSAGAAAWALSGPLLGDFDLAGGSLEARTATMAQAAAARSPEVANWEEL